MMQHIMWTMLVNLTSVLGASEVPDEDFFLCFSIATYLSELRQNAHSTFAALRGS